MGILQPRQKIYKVTFQRRSIIVLGNKIHIIQIEFCSLFPGLDHQNMIFIQCTGTGKFKTECFPFSFGILIKYF